MSVYCDLAAATQKKKRTARALDQLLPRRARAGCDHNFDGLEVTEALSECINYLYL